MIIPSSSEMFIKNFKEWDPKRDMDDSLIECYPEYAIKDDHFCDEISRMDAQEALVQSDKDNVQELQAQYIEKRYEKYKTKQLCLSIAVGGTVGVLSASTGGIFSIALGSLGFFAGTKSTRYIVEDVFFKNNVYKFNCEARARGYGKARIDRIQSKIRQLNLIIKSPDFLLGKTQKESTLSSVQCKKAIQLLQKQYDHFIKLWEQNITSIGVDKSLFGLPKTIKQVTDKDKTSLTSFYLKDHQLAVVKSSKQSLELFQFDSEGFSKFIPKSKPPTGDVLEEREGRLIPYKKNRSEYSEDSYFSGENLFSLFLSRDHERSLDLQGEREEAPSVLSMIDSAIRSHRKDDSIELMKRPVDEMRERFQEEFLEHKERIS